jgi:peptide-methionine (S)-S-oxide reductase
MPLHHAVSSGNLETVQAMLEGNPYMNPRDSAWAGTPLGWADYYVRSGTDPERLRRFQEIKEYLQERGGIE